MSSVTSEMQIRSTYYNVNRSLTQDIKYSSNYPIGVTCQDRRVNATKFGSVIWVKIYLLSVKYTRSSFGYDENSEYNDHFLPQKRTLLTDNVKEVQLQRVLLFMSKFINYSFLSHWSWAQCILVNLKHKNIVLRRLFKDKVCSQKHTVCYWNLTD